jgi:fatty-acyl-CoA synthase
VSQPSRRFGAVLFTAYVILLVAITMPPAWLVLLVVPRGTWSDRIVKHWARAIVRLSGCSLRVAGAGNIPSDRPVVLVSNHTSYVDSIALMAAIPLRYRFVVAKRYTRWPMIGTAIRKAGYITVDQRSAMTRAASFDDVTALVRGGGSVLMYPEGHRARGADLDPFRSGAFRAAVEVGCPIVPISVRGTRVIWPPGTFLMRPNRIEIMVHRALVPEGTGHREIVRLRDAARAAIASSVIPA